MVSSPAMPLIVLTSVHQPNEVLTMKATLDIKQLNLLIDQLSKAEKITKTNLSVLSRELLAHSIEHKDASLVNKVLGGDVLSPANLRIARLYFAEFMPFAQELVNRIEGGKAVKQLAGFKNFSVRRSATMMEKVEEWLADGKNDIWAWQQDNVQMEKKPADYAAKLTKLVQKALSDDDEGLSALAILDAVIAGGVDPVVMADILADAQDKAA